MKTFLINNTDSQRNVKVVVDEVTGANISIPFDEAMVNDGKAFHSFVSALNPGTNDKVSIAFKTPNSEEYVFLLPFLKAGGLAKMEIYSGPSITADSGSSCSVINQNENSSNTSHIIDSVASVQVIGSCRKNSTFTGGVLKYEEFVGSTKDSGNGSRGTKGLILKKNTVYVVSAEALLGSNFIALFLAWFEHTSIN
jgi:hypothetical protein